jgi:hypothetical protein
MKDDKLECQLVIKEIEKHYKKKNSHDNLTWVDYCLMWEKVLKKTGYQPFGKEVKK